ncbi:hypothetical protein O181_069028 [Austropuccinia psidii MF-1]|uniref:Uncharacterized protein n=1 Tax=Austropuccinia psidii MF-1 TaxID=1389203 RepID=A0A9Q3I5Z7_9BASI|nr:hypothetical protein [Austropuccinia psidii MF-1]
MAAAFFLQSLDNDKELSSLCQALYSLRPFELSTITNRVSVEHAPRESSHDHALFIDNSKQAESLKTKEKNKSEGGRKKTGFRDKKKGKNNNQGTVEKPSQEQDTNKRIKRIEQLLEKLQHTAQSMSVNAASELAGRTVENDLMLLENPTPINKHINTFLNPVKVTHEGNPPVQGDQTLSSLLCS